MVRQKCSGIRRSYLVKNAHRGKKLPRRKYSRENVCNSRKKREKRYHHSNVHRIELLLRIKRSAQGMMRKSLRKSMATGCQKFITLPARGVV